VLQFLSNFTESPLTTSPNIVIPKHTNQAIKTPSPHSPQVLRQLENEMETVKQENRQLFAKLQQFERSNEDLVAKLTLMDVEITKAKAREIDREHAENELRDELKRLEVQVNFFNNMLTR
jgi:predicted RNase H-like nuclease (RuvC/YqgF family)